MEGLDGSGKATQTGLLCQYLESRGRRVRHIEFPDYREPSSALVKMYLNKEFGSNPGDVNAYAASSFYAVDPVSYTHLYDADGSLVYEGHWENDEFQGQGRYFSNGEKVYEGEFSHNQFEGQGLEYQNGEIAYRGGYVCSSREGLGVLYENGEPRYAGEFRQNRMHGRINEIQNGRVLAECVYQDGVLRYRCV